VKNINVSNLTFGYRINNSLFKNLNLQLEKGNIYGLLGLNGAGKSTLMKLIAGLLRPQDGSIDVFGYVPFRRDPDFLSDIYMISEEMFVPSIMEDEYVSSYAPFYRAFDYNLFERCLSDFDVPRGKKLNRLSLGQKKKFLLSFGLACGSTLLVLDEPTNGLDIPSKGLFRRLVAESVNDERIIIISTHQVKDVESLIDPVIILNNGRVVFTASLMEIGRRIHMRRSFSPPENQNGKLIYSEAVVGGYWSVWEGPDEEEGSVDMEVLFNSVISSPDYFEKILNGETVNE